MKKKVFRINLFLLLILVMLLSASCGRNRATTMKLIKIDGEVGVENEKGKSVDLIENLGLYNGYGIGTQPKSFAWIDLDDTKLTKMDEKSDVDIIKDGKKLELVVNSGGLFFNVTKPLEDDESMDIRTSTTICGIRGTCGWVESQGDISYVGLLDGKVECTVTVDGKEETVRVNTKELLIVKKDGENVTYEVKELTYKDVPEFVQVEISDEPFALEEESYIVDIKDYIGTFMNGQNVDAGKLTITEINSQSVNVRLEAFKTHDAGEVSTIFEEVGYPFENGIYLDISGQRVEIRKQNHSISGNNYDGYILDVPEKLKQDWDILLNYEKEYVSIAPEETAEIDRFIKTYAQDYGNYDYFLDLSIRDNGLLGCTTGNDRHGGFSGCEYADYSINGNELKATRTNIGANGEENVTDIFVLNDDGSISAAFSEGMFAPDGIYGVSDSSSMYDSTEDYP